MTEKYFTKAPPFINRIKEQEYLKQYLYSTPTAIQFVYGPKSTGKTALINKVIEELPQDRYAINYLDMRRVLIANFNDFKHTFFPKSIKGKIKEIVSGIKINLGFFGWDVDDEKMLEDNVFALMEQKLRKANEKGIRPVIIIDEFQYLKDIVIDKENNLLLVEELWKFFIALTKVTHLAHVVCLTSDSYYIEELYMHTKLSNTSKFYLVDHLEKNDVVVFLNGEGIFEEEIVEYFWENLGGSVWEIWQAILDYKNTGEYKKHIQTMIDDKYALVDDLIENKKIFKGEDLDKFMRISRIIAKEGEYIKKPGDDLYNVIKKTVEEDIWFYDPRRLRITANSQTVRKAFERL